MKASAKSGDALPKAAGAQPAIRGGGAGHSTRLGRIGARAVIGISAASLAIGNASPPARPSGRSYETAPPMDVTVRERIMPQLASLLAALLRDGRATRLDGVPVFEAQDKFLPGKIAAALAFLLTDTPRDDPRFAQYLAGFRTIADLTVDDPNDSWGIFYYVSALERLHKAGLLDRAVSPATLTKLHRSLDWRRFVRPDMTLIDLPNNYYGVAFSIARLRMLLGWEDESGSEKLLARMIDHYRRYSGTYGFADETDGEGRFDRYSVLLIGEIAQRLIETGRSPTPEIKSWLRRSVDLMLLRFNMTGEGWEYGRSIGPYGETCFLEVMTAAATFGILTPREQRMAYAFSSRIAARYADFWISPRTGSVNMWDDGRRTDAYRGKNRILGENLSLARQYIYTDEEWNRLGFRGQTPASSEYGRWLAALPKSTLTWFARGDHDRGLVTIRDGDHVIGLPLINGADGQHMHNPYFPVPNATGLFSGAADATYPQLVFQLTLSDGSVLMPLSWFRDVKMTRQGVATVVTYRQDMVDRMGGPNATKDDRLAVETRYVFEPGRITRSDRLVPRVPLGVASIKTEFASFSGGVRPIGSTAVRYAQGEVTGFTANGFDHCDGRDEPGTPYQAPTGPMHSVVRCTLGARRLAAPLRLGWRIDYARPAAAKKMMR